MKKPIRVMTSAAFLLGLAGCGVASATSSSSSSGVSSASSDATVSVSSETTSSSTASSSSSSSSSLDPASLFKEFLASLAGNNATLSFPDFVKREFLGKKAEFNTYLGDYASNGNFGYIVSGSQGIFDFDIIEGALVLGNVETPASSLDITDVFFSICDLAGSASVWKNQSGFVFTTADAGIGGLLCSLGGYSSYVSSADSFFTKITITEALDVADVESTMVVGSQQASVVGEISDIGVTEETAVTAYLANPATVASPTSWKAETQEAMNGLINEVLPLPTGVSYALSEEIDKDDAGAITGVSITDFACGDILAGYQSVLLAQGWVLNETRTDATDIDAYGYIMYMYEKVKTEATDTAGPVVYTVQLDYIPVSTMSVSNAMLFPYGELQIMCSVYQSPLVKTVSGEQLNAYYSTIKTSADAAVLPVFDFGANVGGIVLTDYTATASALFGVPFINYSDAVLSFASEADALALVTSMSTALTAKGLEDGGSDLTNGLAVFTLEDDAFAFFGFSIQAAVQYDDAGVYQGGVLIEVLAA